MAGLTSQLFRTGLSALWFSGVARASSFYLAGKGAVLMLHRVQPRTARPFAPNASLSITPSNLERLVASFRQSRLDIVSLDEALERVKTAGRTPRFVCFTFDDGYRDNLEHAAPIFRRHGAPFTVYASSSFHDRSYAPWWCALEHVIGAEQRVRWQERSFDTRGAAGKQLAFDALVREVMTLPVAEAKPLLERFVTQHGTSFEELAARDICSWDELRALRASGAYIGCHTVSHAVLAREPEDSLRRELSDARARIEAEIGQSAHHLAYPYGQRDQAGAREIRIAGELGFATAVTTRKGALYAAHAGHCHAWPRVEVTPSFERRPRYLHTILSGLPLLAWNRGRLAVTD